MYTGIGIALAFVAMLSWGFGDFMIQKSARKLGDFETLFLISGFGVVLLLPFVFKNIPAVLANSGNSLIILSVASVVIFIGALLDFEALKAGKLAIVEPIWSLEIPAAAIAAYFILGERISITQIVLIISLVVCLFLVGLKNKDISKKFFLEKGVFIALFGAIVMGLANFLMGWGGRVSDPLMVCFFTNVIMTLFTGVYLVYVGKLSKTFLDIGRDFRLVIPMCIADNVAWIAFVFAMFLAPIAIATALSESYILVAVLLGLAINHERIHTHQKVGLVGAILTAVILAVITTG